MEQNDIIHSSRRFYQLNEDNEFDEQTNECELKHFNENPYETAGPIQLFVLLIKILINFLIVSYKILNKKFFTWVHPLIKYGKDNRINNDDLGPQPKDCESELQKSLIENYWNQYKSNSNKALLKSIIMAYKKDVSEMFGLNLIKCACIISQPILISLILDFIDTDSDSDGGTAYGLLLIIIYILIDLVSNIISEQLNMIQKLLQIKIKNGIICLIYEKILKLSSATNKIFSQGEIINFIDVDANKIKYLLEEFSLVIRFPILVVFGFCLLMYYFGYSIIAAILIGTISFLSLFIIEKVYASVEDKVLIERDKRMRLTTEIVNNIKVIKLNSLSDLFSRKVISIRNDELSYFKIKLILDALKTGISWFSTPMMILSMLLVFFQTGHTITVAKAFAGIQVLYFLERPLKWFPDFLGKFFEFEVSLERINKFLMCNEYNAELVQYSSNQSNDGIDISIKGANFTWGGLKQNFNDSKLLVQNEDFHENQVSSQNNLFEPNIEAVNESQESFNSCVVLK